MACLVVVVGGFIWLLHRALSVIERVTTSRKIDP